MQLVGFREKRVIAFKNELTPWKWIDPSTIVNQASYLIEKGKTRIEQLLEDEGGWTRQTFLEFESITQEIKEATAPLFQLSVVKDNEAVRSAIEQLEPQLAEFSLWKAHNKRLYSKHLSSFRGASLPSQADFLKALQLEIQHCENMGIQLSAAKQATVKELLTELMRLERKFAQNLLDAELHTVVRVNDPSELEGVPQDTQERALQKDGSWLFHLDDSTCNTLLKFAHHEGLRHKVYRASTTLASDKGAFPEWDNGPLVLQIIKLRTKLAALMGTRNFAEWQLENHVLNTPEKVLGMLDSLDQAIRLRLETEKEALMQFAREEGRTAPLQPWDLTYIANLFFQKRYQLDPEAIRAYFPISQVLGGMMEILLRLFKLRFRCREVGSVWAPEVRFFEFFDEQENVIGGVYFDLFVRKGKRSGAWVDSLYGMKLDLEGVTRRPVMLLHTNFPPLNAQGESYLTHEEVVTLFHEMGHALQGFLTRVYTPSVSGLNGIAHDAIEIASQIFESWAWQPEALRMLSRHPESGESLPDSWIERIIAARQGLTALHLGRQLLFCEFDMKVHSLSEEEVESWTVEKLNTFWKALQSKWLPSFAQDDFNRFPQRFAHIFAGGYAAGYYSYLHSEMMARDFFEAFEEHDDIFHEPTAFALRQDLFARGAVGSPAVQLRHLRGRWPSMTPLLRWYGLTETSNLERMSV